MSELSNLLESEEAARTWIGAAFAPTADQWKKLDYFVEMLISESVQQNLIASSTIPTMWVRHIADSAQLLSFDTRDGNGLWVDLGSGAGLPGLVIAILSARPILLVESRKRRCDFLRTVAAELGLANVEVVEGAVGADRDPVRIDDQRARFRAFGQAARLIRPFFHRIDALAAAKRPKRG